MEEYSLKAFGMSNMANADNWLPIQYETRKTSKKFESVQTRRNVKTQTNSSRNNRSRAKSNLPHFNFPGPQTGSETSIALSNKTKECSCKCSSGEAISFVQAYRKRMQYERLGIPITVQEVLSMRKVNSQNSKKTSNSDESQVESKKDERFHDSCTQTDLIQFQNDKDNKEPSNNSNNLDDDNDDIKFKSDHSDSVAKKYFTASNENEVSKRYRDIGRQENFKKTTQIHRPSNPLEITSSSDSFVRTRRGSERKSSGINKGSLYSKTERNSSRRGSSDLKKSKYFNDSAKYHCSDENISVSEQKSNENILPHFNTKTKRAQSSQSKDCSCSCESTKTNKLYGCSGGGGGGGGVGAGPKQKSESESDDMQFLSYSNVQKKRAPFRQSKNCICSCESTKANYLYCGPVPKSNDIKISTHPNVPTERASSFQSKSESSKVYQFNVDSDSTSDDSSCLPSSRVQTNRFTSYQPKFQKYSCESTNAHHHFIDGPYSKSTDNSFIPHAKAQTKRFASFQPKFEKRSCASTSPYNYTNDGRLDPKLLVDIPPNMPHSKVQTKFATSFQPKYRSNTCDTTKAKYLNRCQERKSDDFQQHNILLHSKYHTKSPASSKYFRSNFWNSTESSDEESKPSDSSEPVYSKCFPQTSVNQLKFDKNMLTKILGKHNHKTTTPRCPYADILKSLYMDDGHRPSSISQKRYDKHNCFRKPTRERGYTPRRFGKSEQNSKGSGTFLYSPSLNIIHRQSSSHDFSSLNPLHCKLNDALRGSLVELKSSGPITDVWQKEILTQKSQISIQGDDNRLSGGLWKKRLALISKIGNTKTSSTFKYKKRNNSVKEETIEKRFMLLREFEYFSELNFKRSNMENCLYWNGIDAIEINSKLCKCPVGSRTCDRILNESLLSHFVNQHLNEPGIELREIFERDRFLLVFNANALQVGRNACMSVLTYGGFRGQSDSKPALRFMPVFNTDLRWPFEKFRDYLPLMLMICRSKRNALHKSLLPDTSYNYSNSNSKRNSNRKRVRFQDEEHRSDEDLIILWVASLELPEPIHVMLSVFNEAMTTTRTSIIKVRSIMKSHETSDFRSNDETHMLLSDADINVLSNFNGDPIYLELSIHEYFHVIHPCDQF